MTHKIKNTISIITRIATILLFVSALFLSCQKNNDNEPEDEPSTINKQDLIGTWALDAKNYLYEDCFKKQRLIFSENEVVRYYYWFDRKETECKEEVWKMSYRLSGDKIILKYTKGNAFSHFSQKIEVIGNELHLTYFDDALSKKTVTNVYKKIVNKDQKGSGNKENNIKSNDIRKILPFEGALPDYGRKWWNGGSIYEVLTDMPTEKMQELAKKVEGGTKNFKLNKRRNKNYNINSFKHYVIFNSLSDPDVAIDFNVSSSPEIFPDFYLKSGEYLPLYDQHLNSIKIYYEGVSKRVPSYIYDYERTCHTRWFFPKALYFYKVEIKETYIDDRDQKQLHTMYFLVDDVKYIDLIHKKIAKFLRAYEKYSDYNHQQFLSSCFYIPFSKCNYEDREDRKKFNELWER